MATLFTEYQTNAQGKLRAQSEVINVTTIQIAIGNPFRITGIDTLPGIAGLVLTAGMAVDTHVLIFERLKDRLREGGTLAIDFGYRLAFQTLFDTNITVASTVQELLGLIPHRGATLANAA